MSAPAPSDYRQHLEIETPEHVLLDYELAGIGSRTLATLVDLFLIFLLLWIIILSFALWPGSTGWGQAWVTVLVFTVTWGYSTFFEGLLRGQTPGKKWLGIRVIRDTGHGVTLPEAAARSLLKFADMFCACGIFLIALHPRSKRLGDMVAGTVVVRDKPIAIGVAAPSAREAGEPGTLGAPELSDEEFQLLRGFVQREPDLPKTVAEKLAHDFAARFAEHQHEAASTNLAFLKQLHHVEAARRQGQFGARAASPTGKGSASVAERLVARKSARWDEFQLLAERVTRRGLDSLSAKELPDFAMRYREVAADLARARTYHADAVVRTRIERLVAAGHNALYREDRRTWRRIWDYLSKDCPGEVVASWRAVLLAFAVFALPAAGGYLLLRENPAMAPQLIPATMLERAEAGVARQAKGEGYLRVSNGSLPAVASSIITNNIGVAFRIFAGGILLGVGSLVLLGLNGLSLGTISGHFANVGLSGYLGAFIVGHGVLELFALWVAGAAGFLLGLAVIAPGDLPRGDAVALAGQRAMRLIGTVVILLVIAGTIEGFISAGGYSVRTRLIMSGGSLFFLVVYLLNGALARAAASRLPHPASRLPILGNS